MSIEYAILMGTIRYLDQRYTCALNVEVDMSNKQRLAGLAVFLGELAFIGVASYLVVRYYL